MNWYFRPQKPGEMTRDPIANEFFAVDAIENPADALIREGIQNALDAKREDKIRIRVFLAIGVDALYAGQAFRWFDGARDHLLADGNGLRQAPTNRDPCPFLVFEDFGTTGLQGDVRQAFDEPGTDNPFFYFFRAEGRSGKAEGARGSWGIGKQVFPRSSQISTYFGVTIRADDGNRLLMGHTILKSHRIGEVNYTPDGFYGEPEQEKDSIMMMPVTDSKAIATFSKDFKISRDNQPGLSILVPYVDPEITIPSLKQAVISGYFYPILKGELSVEFETPREKITIDAESLLKETASLEGDAPEDLASLVRLAEWAAFHSTGKEYVLTPCSAENPKWSDDLIPAKIIDSMRKDLDGGKNFAVRVGILVHEKEKKPVPSHFYIYICQDGFEGGRPIFIRKGIIISDNHPPRSRGVRSLVIVDHKPLANLLGDSENPAHTQWQKYSSHFTNKYENGKYCIEFIIKIVSNLVNALGAKEKGEDPYLLLDVFSLPADLVDEQPPKPEEVHKKPGHTITPPVIHPVPKKKPYQISQIKGGFKIEPGDLPAVPPLRLNIQVAYDLRRGNPVKKYQSADFQLDKAPVNYKDSMEGVSVVSVENNQILVDILKTDFQLVVTGFDKNRDLFVNIIEV